MKLSWGSGGGCLGGDEEEMEVVKARALALVKRNEKRKRNVKEKNL